MHYLLYTIAILGLEVLVAALIWIWYQTFKSQQTHFQAASKDTYAKLAEIIEETSRHSQKALSSALETASKFEKTVDKQSQEMAKAAQASIKKQTEWQNNTNQQLWLAYEETLNQETKRASQQLMTLITQQAATLNEDLAKTFALTQSELKTTLTADMAKAQQAIAAYQTAEVERIHTAAQNITKQVVTDLIGRELTPADHHQLVLNQLLKALQSVKN